jgi:protein CpxP
LTVNFTQSRNLPPIPHEKRKPGAGSDKETKSESFSSFCTLHFAFCIHLHFFTHNRQNTSTKRIARASKVSESKSQPKKSREVTKTIMSLKRKILTGITSGFAVVALSSFAMAQDNRSTTTPQQDEQKSERKAWKRGGEGKREGFRRGGRGGGFGMRGLRELNLTDAQKEQIRGILESKRANREANQTQREELRQIVEAKRSGTITAEQEARLKTFREQRREAARQLHEQILAVLTPEQKAQLEQLKQERQKRREEFRQRRQQDRTTPQTSGDN